MWARLLKKEKWYFWGNTILPQLYYFYMKFLNIQLYEKEKCGRKY